MLPSFCWMHLVPFEDEGLMASGWCCGLFRSDLCCRSGMVTTINKAKSISATASNALLQVWCKDHWKLQQPELQWTLGWIRVISEASSWTGGWASTSMSTQVYRAGGNKPTRDHLKLATTDASTHHGPTYSHQEGQTTPRGGWSHVK